MRADGGLQVECSLGLGSVRRGLYYARHSKRGGGRRFVCGGGWEGWEGAGVRGGKDGPQEGISQLETAEF